MPGKALHELDNLPYRCPKCSTVDGFISLQMLREHLEIEHTDYNSPLLRRSYDFMHTNRLRRTESPQMEMFSTEAAKLEKQLSAFKDAENKHKIQWQKVKYTLNDLPTSYQNPQSYTKAGRQTDNVPNLSVLKPSIHGRPIQQQELNKENKNLPHTCTDYSFDEGNHFGKSSSGVRSTLWMHTNKDVTDLSHLVDRLKEQLQFKDSQLSKATEELKSLTTDRLDLQRQVLDLSKGKEDSSVRQSHLEGQLEEKDKLILFKQNEITTMSNFLRELSIKESGARQRLEDYVNLLLERTERAEAKLRRREEKESFLPSRPQSFRDPLTYTGFGGSDLRREWDRVSGVMNSQNQDDYLTAPQQSQLGHISHMSAPLSSSTPHPQQTNTFLNSTFPPQMHQQQQQVHHIQPITATSTSGAPILAIPVHMYENTGFNNRGPEEYPRLNKGLTTGASPSGFSQYSVGEVIEGGNKLKPTTLQQKSYDARVTNQMTDDRQTPSVSNLDSAVGTLESNDERMLRRNVLSTSLPSSPRDHSVSSSHWKLPPRPSNTIADQYSNSQAASKFNNTDATYRNPPVDSNAQADVFAGNHDQYPNSYQGGKKEEAAAALEKQQKWLREQLQSVEEQLKYSSTPRDESGTNYQPPPSFAKYLNGNKVNSNVEDEERSALESGENSEDIDTDSEFDLDDRRVDNRLHFPHHNYTEPISARTRKRYDALYCVFMYLDTRSLSQVSGVCKEWLKVSRDPSLWRNVELKNSRISSKKWQEIERNGANVPPLRSKFAGLSATARDRVKPSQFFARAGILYFQGTMHDTQQKHNLFSEQIQKLYNHHAGNSIKLKMSVFCTADLSLSMNMNCGLKPKLMRPKENREDYEKSIRGSLEAGLEQLLKVSSNTLLSLKFMDCGELLTDRCLWLASCYSPHLVRVAYVTDTDPAGPEVIYSLGAGCRNITTLLVPPQFPNYKPHKFNNKAVQKIAQSWPNLRVLCIGGVDVNAKGLEFIGKYCRSLEVLEFDHMCDIIELTAAAMCLNGGLENLHTLEFTFTPVTPKAIVYFKNKCPRLKTINVLIGMSDYFEDISNPLHCDQYEEIVYQLKTLRKRPEFQGVLFIRSDYG